MRIDPRTEQERADRGLSRVRMLGVVVGALVAVGLLAAVAQGVDRNFAGSAQLDYLAVPTQDVARGVTFDGFTTELSLKVAADVTDEIGASVKACYGCHGFEMGMAYVDVRPWDALGVRVGRFTPSFGDFPARHDPANHRTSDKPLPYDMGRMMRLREWNMSILPAPYVDNGLEVGGTFLLGEDVDLDWASYVIGGLKGTSDAFDVDFIQSRSGDLYYVDNNSRPSVGGRMVLAWRLGEETSMRLGGSGMWGHYDPGHELEYFIVGADAVLKHSDWTLRAEYLLRRTEMHLSAAPEERFKYGPGATGEFDPFSLKDGFYVSLDAPMTEHLELVLRADGMRRMGNLPAQSLLRSTSAVLRYTGGINVLLERSYRIKLSGELYDFSDFEDEVGVHAGLVGAF